MAQPTIYTIGHSNVSGEAFIALLRGYELDEQRQLSEAALAGIPF